MGTKNDRKPAVAGKFYSGDSASLRNNLATFFEDAVPPKNGGSLQAIIVPHAGYVFSGQVAASGFNQINPDKKYKRIFIIGSSHTTHFEGASVYAKGNFVTPLGLVPVDTAVASSLIKSEKLFQFTKSVHADEHSLEVELPFLQYRLRNPFSIVPIIIGGQSPENCRRLAAALKPWFTDDNLFVISSDFSHYPDAAHAVEVDHLTANAILQNDPQLLLSALDKNEKANVPGLVTSLCGWTSVLTMLYLTKKDSTYNFVHLQYMNSSNSPYGDTNRVVGYNSIAVFTTKKAGQPQFSLTDDDKKQLLNLARKHYHCLRKSGEGYFG